MRKGVELTPLNVSIDGDAIEYDHVSIAIDRGQNVAEFTISGPADAPPADAAGVAEQGVAFLAVCAGARA